MLRRATPTLRSFRRQLSTSFQARDAFVPNIIHTYLDAFSGIELKSELSAISLLGIV
jgi:hypothetical protein